ncbi:N-acetylglucosamine kinase [Sinorhizobium meliloti]|uniref:N-acetylglucosamine kinase n=1 Tax=Rhizobium meliloti TaxID=382 RepID=UPI00398CA551
MKVPQVALGIDVGGTKTRWMIARDGVLIADHQVSTSAWRQGAFSDEDCLRLKQIVTATFDGPGPDRVALGANGCSDDEALERCESALQRATNWNVRVVNDAELVAATGGGRGISLIAGTGSIAVARDRAGYLNSAGGWGWLVGDDGGGAGLVRRAVQEALAAEDSGRPDELLSRALMESLGIPKLQQTNERLSVAPSAALMARHAPVVFAAAAQGSVAARLVLADGASHLADLVGRLLGRGVPGPVFAAGGIFENQPSFFNQVSRLIRQRHRVIALLVQDPPVVGALRLAQQIASPAARRPRKLRFCNAGLADAAGTSTHEPIAP